MDLCYTAEEDRFRREVREFFRTALPADIQRKTLRGQRLSKDDVVRWTRRRLAWSAYGLMAVAAASAIAMRGMSGQDQLFIIAGWAVAYAVLFIAIERRAPRVQS